MLRAQISDGERAVPPSVAVATTFGVVISTKPSRQGIHGYSQDKVAIRKWMLS